MAIKTELVWITAYYDIGDDMYLSSVLESVKKKGITEDNIININRIDANNNQYIEIIYKLDDDDDVKLHDMEDTLTDRKENGGMYSSLYNDLIKDIRNKKNMDQKLIDIQSEVDNLVRKNEDIDDYISSINEDLSNALQALSSEMTRKKYGRL